MVCWLVRILPLPLLIACLSGCHGMPSEPDASAPPERCHQVIPGNPRVTKFTFLGGLPQQPQTLRFRVEWEDNNADLRGGTYRFFVNGEARALQSLSRSLVGEGPSGSFELLLPLSSIFLKPGTRVSVELLLKDKRATPSNRPLLVLERKS